ncbi:glycosyltransferase family 29 protein [Gemmobacter denitrificans]|uniref:Glycosyltransferase family 29 protein n=1 Tax=Gemmobacter denitrificans TaxID=3123040 RepID=A0ABU8BV74_9RHOB
MNRLQYLFAKWRGDETAFAAASITEAELLHYVACKQVALVGNSRALAEQDYGAEIDSADVVIRINGAPMPSA